MSPPWSCSSRRCCSRWPRPCRPPDVTRGAPVGVPVVPPGPSCSATRTGSPSGCRPPGERHGGGSGRARRGPAPGPAQPPGGGRAAGRRALPAGARHPGPGVRRRGRLVRRTGSRRTGRRRSSPVLPALTRRFRELPRTPRPAAPALTGHFCQGCHLTRIDHAFGKPPPAPVGIPRLTGFLSVVGLEHVIEHRGFPLPTWPGRYHRACGWRQHPRGRVRRAGGLARGGHQVLRTGWPGSAACPHHRPRARPGARALRGLPMIAAAFAAGRLSYAKVRALTRIAAADCEAALLEFALGDRVAGRAVLPGLAARRGRHRPDPHGRTAGRVGQSFSLLDGRPGLPDEDPDARGDRDRPVGHDRLLAEREARRERADKEAQARHEQIRAAGQGRPRRRRTLHSRTRRSAWPRTHRGPPHRRPRRRRGQRGPGPPARRSPRRVVVVRVDADVLADDTAAGRAYFEGGPAITGAQARACSARPPPWSCSNKDANPSPSAAASAAPPGPAPGAAAP